MIADEVTAHLGPRRVGFAFLLAGLGGVAWVLYDARAARFFSLRPCISSVAVSMGLWMVIESPTLPARELTPLGHAFAGVGMVVGLAFISYVMGWFRLFVEPSDNQDTSTATELLQPTRLAGRCSGPWALPVISSKRLRRGRGSRS